MNPIILPVMAVGAGAYYLVTKKKPATITPAKPKPGSPDYHPIGPKDIGTTPITPGPGVPSPAQQAAQKIAASPVTPGAPPTPLLAAAMGGKHPTIRLGSAGPDVVLWQQLIGAPTTGKFDEQTKTLTVYKQKSLGVTGDGVVGPGTWGAVIAQTQSNTPTPTKPYITPTTPPANKVSPYNPKTAKNSVSAHDLAISFRDNASGLTLQQIASDPANQVAIRVFQQSAGLTADGKVGTKTQQAYQYYISY